MAETKTDIKTVNFTLDDRALTVPAGTLVIEAAKRQGIEVPSFCYYQGLSLQAACRMCLVEVERMPKLQTACTLVAMDGMVVRTNTPQVYDARKGMLEFLLANHPLDCPVCDKGGECELQDMVFRYGVDSSRFIEEKLHVPEEKWSPLVYYDAPRCILCFRCVRVCDEGMDVKALGVGFRGVHSVIIPNAGDHLDCEECGMCIDICPVGALTSGAYRYKTRPWEMQYVSTVCTHCSNGCKTTLSVRNNEILRANTRDLSGINKDFLCAKGRFGFDFTSHAERLKFPMIRRNGNLEPASWEDAMNEIAARLGEIRKTNGADAIGFLGSNRTSNEENYLFNRLARAGVGTNNIDHHRTADYAGLITALGEKAPESLASMEQLGAAKAIVLIGNDPTEQNPLVAWQIRTAVRLSNARFYLVNSEEVRLHRKARQFVRVPQGSEPAAVRWIANGEAELDAELVLELITLKTTLDKENNVVILFGDGLKGRAISDLVAWGAKLPGHTRYMALGDYVNSRGASDMGVLPSSLPGYAHAGDSSARERWGKLWGATLPSSAGMNARQMMDAAGAKLRALYVMGANPVKTFGAWKLDKLDFLVVQDLFLTETAQLAHVVLPAASAYEKDGTVTNTAGQIQKLRRGPEVMGPRSDFDLLRIVSHKLAALGLGKAMHLRTPEAAFEEIRCNVRGYNVPVRGLLTGGAECTAPVISANGHKPYDVPVDMVFSSRDTLFTSGTLGRYCSMVRSAPEAAK